MFDPEKFGEAMGEAIRAAVEPLLKRIEELESKHGEFSDFAKSEISLALNSLEVPKGEQGVKGVDGKDGLGLAGAMIDRDGALQITLTNGEVKNLGQIVGKDGSDGKDGVSLESFDMEYLPESHEITVKAVCQGRTKELRYPAGGIHSKGYWLEGVRAKAGEAWVQDGSLWIAVKDNASKPATNDEGWIIAARKGRDGERGMQGKSAIPDAPIKLVN
jgi:hypothetical protein